MTDQVKGDVAAAIDAVKGFHGATVQVVERPGEGGGVPALVMPEKMKVQSVKPLLDEYLERPERVRCQRRFTRLASFLAYVQSMRTEATAGALRVYCLEGFGLETPPTLEAVLDDHEGNESANWAQNRAGLDTALSREWQDWMGIDGVGMEQSHFAEFLETQAPVIMTPPDRALLAHAPDPLTPEYEADKRLVERADRIGAGRMADPAELRDMARFLEVNVESKVVSAIKLETGESQIVFEEVQKDAEGKPIKAPGCFVIRIPIFHGGTHFRLLVRLRWRKIGGVLRFTILLDRPAEYLRTAIDDMANEAGEALSVPVLFGAP